MFISKISKLFGSRMPRSDLVAFRSFRKSLESKTSFQRMIPWTGYIKNEPWDMSVKVRGERSAPKDFLHFVRKSRRSNSLLVLTGPQCSGKTTLLKKTQRDMFALNPRVMPIYVNLAKWKGEWSDGDIPNVSDLVAFIKQSLSHTSWEEWMISNHFDAWHRAGRMFFIFDALDEVPFVLSAKDAKRMATQVLHLIHLFLLSGGRYQGVVSAGIDSTSFFTIAKHTEVVMLPVREKVILKEFDNWQLVDTPDAKTLLCENPHWLKACGNPAILSMMLGHFSNGGKDLPKDLRDLLDSVVNQRFKMSLERLQKMGVSEGASRWVKECRAFSFPWSKHNIRFAENHLDFYGVETPRENVMSALTYMVFLEEDCEHLTASFASHVLRLYFAAVGKEGDNASIVVKDEPLDDFVSFPGLTWESKDAGEIRTRREIFLSN